MIVYINIKYMSRINLKTFILWDCYEKINFFLINQNFFVFNNNKYILFSSIDFYKNGITYFVISLLFPSLRIKSVSTNNNFYKIKKIK